MKIHIGDDEIVYNDEDHDIVQHFNLSIVKDFPRKYVMCCRDKYHIFLHHLVAGKHKGYVIHHINFNGLDNRRGNLAIVTPQDHGWIHQYYTMQRRNKR